MSDQKLRDLERRWKETGTVEDEAAYLLERVRVGDLSRERLELAAYCGNQGAQTAIGLQAALSLSAWSHGLIAFGKEPCVRAALAALRIAASTSQDHQHIAARAQASLEAWIACPCDQHSTGLLLGDDVTSFVFGGLRGLHACSVHSVLALADLAPEEASGVVPAQHTRALEAAVDLAGEAAVRASVCQHLSGWALRSSIDRPTYSPK